MSKLSGVTRCHIVHAGCIVHIYIMCEEANLLVASEDMSREWEIFSKLGIESRYRRF